MVKFYFQFQHLHLQPSVPPPAPASRTTLLTSATTWSLESQIQNLLEKNVCAAVKIILSASSGPGTRSRGHAT